MHSFKWKENHELWKEDDVEEDGCGLFYGILALCVNGLRKNAKNQDSWSPDEMQIWKR
jgi:hypothetical protein